MKCTFKRMMGGLVPEDEAAQKLWDRTDLGTLVEVNASIPKDQRSLAQHGLFFRILTHVFENLPERYETEIPNVDVLRARIFFQIGFTHKARGPDGRTIEWPKSIEFAKLGQGDFYEQVWLPTIRLIDKMSPGLGEAFEAEYERMVT